MVVKLLLLYIHFLCIIAIVAPLTRVYIYIYIYILSIPLRELLVVIGPKGPAADGVFQEQDFIVVDPYGVKGDGQNLRYGDIICLRTPEVCLSLVAHAEIFNVLSYYTLPVFVCEYIHEYVC